MWWACWGSGTGLRPQTFVQSLFFEVSCHCCSGMVGDCKAAKRPGRIFSMLCEAECSLVWLLSVKTPYIHHLHPKVSWLAFNEAYFSDLCIRRTNFWNSGMSLRGTSPAVLDWANVQMQLYRSFGRRRLSLCQNLRVFFLFFFEGCKHRSLSHTRSELLLEDQPYLAKNLKEYLGKESRKIRKRTPCIDMKDKKFLEGQNFYIILFHPYNKCQREFCGSIATHGSVLPACLPLGLRLWKSRSGWRNISWRWSSSRPGLQWCHRCVVASKFLLNLRWIRVLWSLARRQKLGLTHNGFTMPGPYARNASWVSSSLHFMWPEALDILWTSGQKDGVVDVSQQVDRTTTKRYECPCLTPKGQHFSIGARRPLTGQVCCGHQGAISFCFHAVQGWRSSSFKDTQLVLWTWSTWQTRRGMVAWIAQPFLPALRRIWQAWLEMLGAQSFVTLNADDANYQMFSIFFQQHWSLASTSASSWSPSSK